MIEIARPLMLTVALITSLLATPALAQTRDQGPWWPHPIWGKDDRAGGSNWITPEKVVAASSWCDRARSTNWARCTRPGCRVYGQRTYSLVIPAPSARRLSQPGRGQ